MTKLWCAEVGLSYVIQIQILIIFYKKDVFRKNRINVEVHKSSTKHNVMAPINKIYLLDLNGLYLNTHSATNCTM